MITKDEAIRAAMSFPGTYTDYPFDENWAAVRHSGSGKIFALIFCREGRVWINCKGTPEKNGIRRELYDAVVPAYHMNKVHWISIILDGSMNDEQIVMILSDSYELTKPKRIKKK